MLGQRNYQGKFHQSWSNNLWKALIVNKYKVDFEKAISLNLLTWETANQSHNAFNQSHNAFNQSHNAFNLSYDALIQSHNTFQTPIWCSRHLFLNLTMHTTMLLNKSAIDGTYFYYLCILKSLIYIHLLYTIIKLSVDSIFDKKLKIV